MWRTGPDSAKSYGSVLPCRKLTRWFGSSARRRRVASFHARLVALSMNRRYAAICTRHGPSSTNHLSAGPITSPFALRRADTPQSRSARATLPYWSWIHWRHAPSHRARALSFLKRWFPGSQIVS